MARIAERDGTRSIIATPHHIPRSPHSAVDEAARRARQLQHVLEWAEVSVQIHPGQENHARTDLTARWDEREAVGLNGTNYVLVEPPFRTYPDFLNGLLGALIERGLTPVLAHPERNFLIQSDPMRVAGLVDMGVLIQVNTGSLLGSYKQPAQDAAITLLRHDLVHAIASDAHAESGKFVPNMQAGFDAVREESGEAVAWMLARDNPLAILDGRVLEGSNPKARGAHLSMSARN